MTVLLNVKWFHFPPLELFLHIVHVRKIWLIILFTSIFDSHSSSILNVPGEYRLWCFMLAHCSRIIALDLRKKNNRVKNGAPWHVTFKNMFPFSRNTKCFLLLWLNSLWLKQEVSLHSTLTSISNSSCVYSRQSHF